MQPNIAPAITIGSVDITACALEDIGWRVTRCPDDPPTNVAPVANAQSVTTAEDSPIVITLTGTDANGDPLSFAIAAVPTFGTLSAISSVPPRTVTYTPGANLNGADSFAFVVSDGTASSPS